MNHKSEMAQCRRLRRIDLQLLLGYTKISIGKSAGDQFGVKVLIGGKGMNWERKRKALRLASANARCLVAQRVYLKTGIDVTRPVQVFALVNRQCNARCKMCDCWRDPNPEELPAETWIRCLGELKRLSPTFHINFSGGEPLVKRDFIQIIEFCRQKDIVAGITTNGILLNEKNVDRVIACNLFNINVSLDSMRDEVHDGIRGVPGTLSRVKKNLDLLMKRRIETGATGTVILKPMVCAENMSGLHEIVTYAQEMGMTGVNFQPVFDWSEESKEMGAVDAAELQDTIDRLIEMKNSGYPILNSEASIAQWVGYFRGDPPPPRESPCVVSLRNLELHANGTVTLCGFADATIGNFADNNIGKIWYSEKARKMRAALIRCNRLCLATCVVKRSMKDYAALFMRMVKS